MTIIDIPCVICFSGTLFFHVPCLIPVLLTSLLPGSNLTQSTFLHIFIITPNTLSRVHYTAFMGPKWDCLIEVYPHPLLECMALYGVQPLDPVEVL